MLSKLLGRDKKESQTDSEYEELVTKIAKMNLTDMRAYLNNNVKDLESCEDGLVEIMKRLVSQDEESKKRFIELDDMDSKIKKAFDLVLALLAHKKITVVAIEYVQTFIQTYQDLIHQYDTNNKQIYKDRFVEAINQAIEDMNKKSELSRKMQVLGK